MARSVFGSGKHIQQVQERRRRGTVQQPATHLHKLPSLASRTRCRNLGLSRSWALARLRHARPRRHRVQALCLIFYVADDQCERSQRLAPARPQWAVKVALPDGARRPLCHHRLLKHCAQSRTCTAPLQQLCRAVPRSRGGAHHRQCQARVGAAATLRCTAVDSTQPHSNAGVKFVA